MSKKRKNAGEGYGYMFSGAFAKKADAVKKERQRKGSFVKTVWLPSGMRYAVMTPRENPRKTKENPVFFDQGIQKYTAHRFSKRFGNIYASGHTKKEALKNLRDRLRQYRAGGAIDSHRGYGHNPAKYEAIVTGRRGGEWRQTFDTRDQAKTWAANFSLEAHFKPKIRKINANPTELLVMGANPHNRDLTIPAGSTITIRMNPENPPEHFTADRARARGISYRAPGLIQTPRQRRVAGMVRKARESDAAALGRLYKRHQASPRPRGAGKVFHELYGRDNPICGARIGGGEVCTRKPGHRGPHLPQGATMRTRSRLKDSWKPRGNPKDGWRPRGNPKDGWRPRGNPSAAAIRARFTGAAAEFVTVHDEPHMPAGDYAQLGVLLALYVQPRPGSQVQQITFPKGTRPIVVSDETARRIYFVGGDQNLTRSLEAFGVNDRGNNTFELGECRRIDYKQRKEHVPEPKLDEWRHSFGEENGARPTLVYDAARRRLLLEGGEYEIREEGIVN